MNRSQTNGQIAQKKYKLAVALNYFVTLP